MSLEIQDSTQENNELKKVLRKTKILFGELPPHYELLGHIDIHAEKSAKAIFDSVNFTQDDFDKLYRMGWSHKDIFDSIEHAGSVLKNGKILTTYLKKST